MKTDIEIARQTKLLPIKDVIKKLAINDDIVEYYGKYKAKIDATKINTNNLAKVVLVTAINPTSAGEGKTTVSIGLHDAMCKLNVNSVLALREPSLGPVFGIKGGATGGGYSQVAPMEDINLHFTGDFHAITTCNNLLCAMIDNHIFQGNELNIDPSRIIFNRCMDMNDRALREIVINEPRKDQSGIITRKEKFNITAASEVMAIMCLSKNINDLKENLGNITVAYTYDNLPVYAKDLKANEAMTILLKDAIKPNIVQTLENNPVLIHCGPFANIAHGCNSIIATDCAIKLSEVCITEAGFGADLGCEKFLDIKARKMNIHPSCVVLVATIRALKLHGNDSIDQINRHDLGLESLDKGLTNLMKHISNLKNVYNVNVIVAINKFSDDTLEEINRVKEKVSELNVEAITTTVWEKGGDGAIELAKKVKSIIDNKTMEKDFHYAYELNDSITEKIEKVCKKIYGASNVIFSPTAMKTLKELNQSDEIKKYPICIAKTQYSLSDDPKLLYIDKPFDITIKDIEVRTGAKLLVCIAGNMLLMPGLSAKPASINMSIKDNIIEGLF